MKKLIRDTKFIKYSLIAVSFIIIVLKMFIFNNFINIIAAVFLLLNNIYCLVKCRKNTLIFFVLFFITYCNYSVCFSSYINFFDDSFFTREAKTIQSSISLNVLLIFSTVLTTVINVKNKEIKKISFFENKSYNPIICLGISVFLLTVLIFGYQRPQEGDLRGFESPIYEYSIILFIIGYYFAGKKKLWQVAITIILSLFITQNVMYGGRITALQLLLLVFFLFLFNGINKKNLLAYLGAALFGGIGLMILGDLRYADSLNFNVIFSSIKNVFQHFFTLDTAYSAYYTSISFVKTMDITTVMKRIQLFGKFLLSMIFGGSKIANSNLPVYTRQYFEHYYGGFLPHYSFFYLGYAGVILVALYLNLILNKFLNKENQKSPIVKFLGLYVTCTVPRWYLYSPSNLIRGVLLVIVCGYIFLIADKIINKYKNNKKENFNEILSD